MKNKIKNWMTKKEFVELDADQYNELMKRLNFLKRCEINTSHSFNKNKERLR